MPQPVSYLHCINFSENIVLLLGKQKNVFSASSDFTCLNAGTVSGFHSNSLVDPFVSSEIHYNVKVP